MARDRLVHKLFQAGGDDFFGILDVPLSEGDGQVFYRTNTPKTHTLPSVTNAFTNKATLAIGLNVTRMILPPILRGLTCKVRYPLGGERDRPHPNFPEPNDGGYCSKASPFRRLVGTSPEPRGSLKAAANSSRIRRRSAFV